ncbi:MAG: hypothetical protein RSA27_06065, partial [Oscillospiraceae bacterium]
MKRKFFALLLSASMIISSGVIPTFAADKVSSLDTVNGETLINERGIEEVSNTNISPYFMDKATKKPATATFSLVGKTVNQSAKTMTIDLKLTNAEQGLAGVKARVDYSNLSTYITNATVKTGINSGIEISENANIITLTKAVSENIPTDSILATLTFNIKDDYYDVVAKSGKLALTIAEAAYIDMSEPSSEQAKPIDPTNISAVDGDVVIE